MIKPQLVLLSKSVNYKCANYLNNIETRILRSEYIRLRSNMKNGVIDGGAWLTAILRLSGYGNTKDTAKEPHLPHVGRHFENYGEWGIN